MEEVVSGAAKSKYMCGVVNSDIGAGVSTVFDNHSLQPLSLILLTVLFWSCHLQFFNIIVLMLIHLWYVYIFCVYFNVSLIHFLATCEGIKSEWHAIIHIVVSSLWSRAFHLQEKINCCWWGAQDKDSDDYVYALRCMQCTCPVNNLTCT